MSIYSGFATRFQEESYDHCLDSLLYVLQKRIIKFYQQEEADEEKFISLILKMHQQLKNMEKNKYLDPKSSQSMSQLISYLQAHQDSIRNNKNIPHQTKKEAEPLPNIEQKSSLPEVTAEKKKSIYWVEKNVEPQKKTTEQEVQTMGTINKDKKQVLENSEFKRTHYNSSAFQGIRLKSGITREARLSPVNHNQQKLTKNKSNSHYLHEASEKPELPFKKEAVNNRGVDTQSITTKRKKTKSLAKAVPNDSHLKDVMTNHEVSDIIKEYIIKVKKSYLKGQGFKDPQDQIIKLNDF